MFSFEISREGSNLARSAYGSLQKGDVEKACTELARVSEYHDEKMYEEVNIVEDFAEVMMMGYSKAGEHEKAREQAETTVNRYLDSAEYILSVMDEFLHNYKWRYGKKLEMGEETSKRFREAADNLQELLEQGDDGPVAPPAKKRKIQGTDVMSKLPHALITKICGYLCTRDLAALSEVSHKWHKWVLKLSDYLTEVDFVRDICVSDLNKYLNICESRHISKIGSFEFIGFEFNQLPDLLSTARDRNVVPESLTINANEADAHFGTREELLSLKRSISGIKSLEISCLASRSGHLDEFIDCFPDLKQLHLTMRFGEAKGFPVPNFTLHVGELDEFNLVFIHRNFRVNDVAEFAAHSSFGHVDKLILDGVPLNERSLRRFLLQATPRHLELSAVHMSAWRVLQACSRINGSPTTMKLRGVNLPQYHNLTVSAPSSFKHLSFSSMQIDSRSFAELLDITGESLEELDLTHIKQMPLLFTDILQRCPNIQTLRVGHCEDLDVSLGQALSSLPLPRLEKLTVSSRFRIGNLFPRGSHKRTLELTIRGRTRTDLVEYLVGSGYCTKVNVV